MPSWPCCAIIHVPAVCARATRCVAQCVACEWHCEFLMLQVTALGEAATKLPVDLALCKLILLGTAMAVSNSAIIMVKPLTPVCSYSRRAPSHARAQLGAPVFRMLTCDCMPLVTFPPLFPLAYTPACCRLQRSPCRTCLHCRWLSSFPMQRISQMNLQPTLAHAPASTRANTRNLSCLILFLHIFEYVILMEVGRSLHARLPSHPAVSLARLSLPCAFTCMPKHTAP